ncbi:nucleoside triphosphate pyrophosphohydrolase family protein [Amycolatopsis aidingensis]|uniref:hypothetical protein n=1 Tax=Amycolatopsis aidingensis TaxID=2842453 RepID=UPI001C0BA3B6|nr:hypothetical protein [Amycolatopsis aidingensis]
MIHDQHGTPVEHATALARIAAALDRRFPHHNTPGDRLGRLLEELGELADAVLALYEVGTALPNSPTGPSRDLLRLGAGKEVEDVLRAAAGIAGHYGIPFHLPAPATRTCGDDPAGCYRLLAELTASAGALAAAVHHTRGMGVKQDKHGTATPAQLRDTVAELVERVLTLAAVLDLGDVLWACLGRHYRAYQRDGYLRDTSTDQDTADA